MYEAWSAMAKLHLTTISSRLASSIRTTSYFFYRDCNFALNVSKGS